MTHTLLQCVTRNKIKGLQMDQMPKIDQFKPNRPKVFLRRQTDPIVRLAVKEYILNRGKRTESVALENLYRALRRGK